MALGWWLNKVKAIEEPPSSVHREEASEANEAKAGRPALSNARRRVTSVSCFRGAALATHTNQK